MERMVTLLRIAAPVVLAVLFFEGAASTHGTDSHVIGTVEQVSPSQVVVRDADGHSTAVALTAETRFRAGDRPARREDLRPQGRVIVDVVKKDGGIVATLVRMARTEQGEAR